MSPVSAGALSCVTYVHNKTGAPLVDAVWYQQFPRSTMSVGTVALFTYKSGVSHVALVEELSSNGFWVSECNYKPGVCGWRFVKYDDYALEGFWSPPNQSILPREFAAAPFSLSTSVLGMR